MDMNSLFYDIRFKEHLETFIPHLFEEARYINTNDETMNMGVGRDREDIIKLVFIKFLKKYNIYCESNIVVSEKLNYDAVFFNKNVQIKTKTVPGNSSGDFKLNWASGMDNANLFKCNFKIDTDILYVRISTQKKQSKKIIFNYINEDVQKEIFYLKGFEGYFNIKDKDSKGIKINNKSLKNMLDHEKTLKLTIPYNLNKNIRYKNRIEFWSHRYDELEEEQKVYNYFKDNVK
jgi:hypothetical protein